MVRKEIADNDMEENKTGRFREELRTQPFENYAEYMDYIFACVNVRLADYIQDLMGKYAAGQGQFKNIMYPDIEIAYNLCNDNVTNFLQKDDVSNENEDAGQESVLDDMDDELKNLLGMFSASTQVDEEESKLHEAMEKNAEEMLSFIESRISVTQADDYPFYQLCKKLEVGHFTVFALAAALLSSTQTSYASVYQIVNENGSLTAPTVESAARLYFGEGFSITAASSHMSECLESLLPIMDLRVNSNMPFSTVLAPDKRMIDYLFGTNPLRLDENYQRFYHMLTDDNELDPIMANEVQLEAMSVSYDQGVRIFSWFGDEGSGRRFFIKHFSRKKGLRAITLNCKKLFVYDFSFVEKALWAVRRECIFTDSCCCLSELDYREDEKEKYIGYMDLAVSKLREHDILIFLMSRDKLPLKSVTDQEFTELELPTPGNQEREDCWKYFSQEYGLDKDVELSEMATKFLFTPGKIKSALKQARSFSIMNHEILISRAKLFEGCYNQMSSELTQKATKVKANFGFEDIVMNASQRETLEHAIDQMTFRKTVYDNWNYTKKYPYGRGLSVLLFGAPGTGKSMCAQVIAHELNLELYRVDLSKVIDKYVGETEKSISMIFREAKKCNVVLFFDECDTLFAKRSDDGGSNQASNNNKTALLLQEVEAYDGVSVLATNYKHNIDPAFFRRMKYI
ncbi:MAG: AAA family ATPase, partial [Lachnospiraceae bacterium]|nr:AAA family ATPase [Lachnospiraceae bacterium]